MAALPSTSAAYFKEEDEKPQEEKVKDTNGIFVKGKGGDNVGVLRGTRGSDFDHISTAAGAVAGEPQGSVAGWVVMIGNLPQETTEENLWDLFHGGAKPNWLQMLTRDSKTGRCPGHQLVRFDHQQDAQQAIDDLNGKSVGENGTFKLEVGFAFANPPDSLTVSQADAQPARGRRDRE